MGEQYCLVLSPYYLLVVLHDFNHLLEVMHVIAAKANVAPGTLALRSEFGFFDGVRIPVTVAANVAKLAFISEMVYGIAVLGIQCSVA